MPQVNIYVRLKKFCNKSDQAFLMLIWIIVIDEW